MATNKIEVTWEYGKSPPVGRWGISTQQVLLTNRNTYTTGYWDMHYSRWLVDGMLLSNETVVAWLCGLENSNG